MSSSTVDMTQAIKDLYPEPGTRIKQWVVDTRAFHAWERETSPAVFVPNHVDNTGARCRNSYGTQGRTLFAYLNHDCCYVCNDLRVALIDTREDIAKWVGEREMRVLLIERDRDKLSDEIEPHRELAPNPFLDFKVKK